MSTTNTIDNLTAEEHKTLAAKHIQAAQDSFDRCDTDGFLSQWANGITGNLHQAKARLAANGGKSVFKGLYAGDRRLEARITETKFGMVWIVSQEEVARVGRKFIPLCGGGKSRIQKQLGLSECLEWDFATAQILGKGRGLSGSAWVAVLRKDDLKTWGQDSIKLTEQENKDYAEHRLDV